MTKKDRGFLFYAAVISGVLLLITLLTGTLLTLYVRNRLIAYTETAPVAMPAVVMSEPDYEALAKRAEEFRSNLEQSKPISELVLSADDINALIARKSNPTARVSEKIHISLKDDVLEAQVSLPLGESGLPLLGGRHFNATAGVKITMDGGVLIITAESLTIKGQPFPEALMALLRKENLARDAYRNPKTAASLSKIDSVRIKDGLFTIKPRTDR